MTSPSLKSWRPFAPNRKTPWNLRRVIHLHRRAGFAATWEEVERDLKDGCKTAVDRLLDGKAYMTGVPSDFDSMSRIIGDAAVSANNPNRLKAWWLYRMIFSPDPLTERLTLMWHNHFATSNIKINNVRAMRRQNDIFRQFARKPFGEMLTNVVKDPAILIWLDADSNRKAHPNENLARELMELFSMGVGNYAEKDVKEVARALTGWTHKNGRFRYVNAYHDDGSKSFLGKRGKFIGDDVLKAVLDHPATAKRLAWRVCEQFFGEAAIDDSAINALADGLGEQNLDVGWAVETVLRSEAFFDDANIGNRVLGPAEFIVGAVRALELFDPPPSTMVLSEWTARLGQDLFYPPNVFGWEGGRTWITTRSMIGRTAFASELVGGSLCRSEKPLDAIHLKEEWDADDNTSGVDLFVKMLVNNGSEPFRKRITEAADSLGIDKAQRYRAIVEMILASPEAQLG